eukprot:1107877-Rhodomonas_salina.1
MEHPGGRLEVGASEYDPLDCPAFVQRRSTQAVLCRLRRRDEELHVPAHASRVPDGISQEQRPQVLVRHRIQGQRHDWERDPDVLSELQRRELSSEPRGPLTQTLHPRRQWLAQSHAVPVPARRDWQHNSACQHLAKKQKSADRSQASPVVSRRCSYSSSAAMSSTLRPSRAVPRWLMSAW